MRLLVTGGAGYIGSHFCKTAQRAGHDLLVVDDLSMGHKEFAKWGKFIQASILDTELMREICIEHQVEGIVHFAAKSLVAESVEKPELYRKVNVDGTKSLLKAIEDTGVKYFVFSSSAATYGQPAVELIDEASFQDPINPYGKTKLECERILLKSKKLKLAILRYFNVIGQDPEGELYEKHEPETHLIPNVLKALRDKSVFGIYGDDYSTPDGTCVRDYVDVNDLANVHLAALVHIDKKNSPLISNVGRGEGESIRQVLNAVEKVFGRLPKTEVRPRRQGDPAQLVASDRYFRRWCSTRLRSLHESLENMKDWV